LQHKIYDNFATDRRFLPINRHIELPLAVLPRALLTEFGDPLSEAGHLPAGGISMHHALLRRAHDDWFGLAQDFARPTGVPRNNGLFDLGYDRAHAGAA
jgi:hypothetical protein